MENGHGHMSSGSLNIPPAVINGGAGGPPQPSAAAGRFDGPRSPPGRQSERQVEIAEEAKLTVNRYKPCPVQVLPSRHLSGWDRLSFQS